VRRDEFVRRADLGGALEIGISNFAAAFFATD